jgi:hypothetical protein
MPIFNMLKYKNYTALFLSTVLLAGYSGINCCPVFAEASELNFKVYNPDPVTGQSTGQNVSATDSDQNVLPAKTGLSAETAQPDANPQKDANNPSADATVKSVDEASATSSDAAGSTTTTTVNTSASKADDKDGQASDAASSSVNPSGESTTGENKMLQGYVRVVPSGTKIPIVMDTAVDSDTSQEGDEFSARTVEDLTIDGTMVIPAGSIIRGRIATLNSPKHLNRSGSVALKFDTVTTPDNRQIPLVANLVARGGVVHARRGMKDIAIDSATFALPTLVALGIGAVAGHSSSSVGVGGGALIGAGVGAAVGLAILLAKKGKKVDVRPGDELKIELAEDLHMPAM